MMTTSNALPLQSGAAKVAPRSVLAGFGGLLDRRQGRRDTTLGRCVPIGDLRVGICAEPLAEPSDACGQELPRLSEPGAATDIDSDIFSSVTSRVCSIALSAREC